MSRTAWIAAAAAAIALAIPGAAAADSIVLTGGHHWDADDHGALEVRGDDLKGHGFQGAGALTALAIAPAVSVSQSVAVKVTNSGSKGGSSSGIVHQVLPIAFPSVPAVPVLVLAQNGLTLPGLPTASAAGTVLGSLPFAGGTVLVLFSQAGSMAGGALTAATGASPAPEPASLILLGTGLVGTLVRKRWFV